VGAGIDAVAAAGGATDTCGATGGGVTAAGDDFVVTGNGACGSGGNGICGGAATAGGSCGVPTMVSWGVAPAVFTCNCSVVPAGSCWGRSAAMTASPIFSAVVPSGMRPITSASSNWPGLNSASSAAGRPVAPWASACSGVIIPPSERIRVNAR
jgi:hypothetical protein